MPAALLQPTVWSFAMPAAIVAGYWMSLRRAREAGLATHEFERATQLALASGLIVSHMVEIVFYQPQQLATRGWLTLFAFWEGLSSYGGFFGAAAALFVFFRSRRWWVQADCLVEGLMVGWIFGRLGCSVAGDHPGSRFDAWFAYPYPDGGRHNLGLYELVFTALVIVPANLALRRRTPRAGSVVAMDCLLYGAGRFALDFLRATDRVDSDPRYLGLTLAHYCSVAVFAFGVLCAWLVATGRTESSGETTVRSRPMEESERRA